MTPRLYQDSKTGKRLRLVGADSEKEDFVLVQSNDGPPFYISRAKLVPCAEDGTPDFSYRYEGPEEAEEEAPEPLISLVETRLNVNTATAAQLSKIPGIGYRVAKQIKSNQSAQPGEMFRSLDQVKAASSRVNWDAVFSQNLIFLA